MSDKINEFMSEFYELLNKYEIVNLILCNDDNGQMGNMQLVKLMDIEGENWLSMKFSGTDKTLCPCCVQKESN